MKKPITLLISLLISLTVYSQGNFDNEFYFRFGYSLPFWSQYGATEGDWADGSKRTGFTGEIGTIFLFKNIPKSDKIALGIDVDYLTVYWHKFETRNEGSEVDLWNVRFGSKVGPSITFSPANRLAFDIYAKADISWLSATGIMSDNDKDEMDGYGDVFSVGISTGINIRYSILMLGFEFNTISPKLESTEYPGEYVGNINDVSSNNSPLPSVSFTIGLSF